MPRSTHVVVTMNSKEELEAIVPTVERFFAERGLELNTEKTKIVHVKDGFNFLGFNVISFKNKCIVRPQKEKVHAFLEKIRDWLRTHKMAPVAAVIRHLNPILRGWANYYRYGNSKGTFNYVDAQVWKAIWRWCLRRHPNKSKFWVYKRYFKRIDGRDRTFFCTLKEPVTGVQYDMKLFRTADMKIVRYVKVPGNASPDNPGQREYWQKRASKRRCSVEELVEV